MQNDLISRSEVLKALEEIRKTHAETGREIELVSTCEKVARELPTAYDVEKVVAELEYKREQADKDRSWWAEHSWKDNMVYNECDISDRKVDCYDEALDCVLNGGKE